MHCFLLKIYTCGRFSAGKYPSISSELKHIKIEKCTVIKKVSNSEILKNFESVNVESIEKVVCGKMAAIRNPYFFEACLCGKKVQAGQRNCR